MRSRSAVSSRAFTLVEIVIAMTVSAVLVGISVPTIRGLQRQHDARKPVAELVRMARTVRGRAMTEQHPYQIAFDHRGFHASEYFSPYGGSEEIDELVKELEAVESNQKIVEASEKRTGQLGGSQESGVNDGNAAPRFFFESYELPSGVQYEIMMKGDQDWTEISGGEFKRWVFQPSGMCDPFKVRVQSDGAFFEVSFHPLTGDISEEESYVE